MNRLFIYPSCTCLQPLGLLKCGAGREDKDRWQASSRAGWVFGQMLTNWTGRISSTSCCCCSQEWGGEVNNLYNFPLPIHTESLVSLLFQSGWEALGGNKPFTTSPHPPDTGLPATPNISSPTLRAQRRHKFIVASLKKSNWNFVYWFLYPGPRLFPESIFGTLDIHRGDSLCPVWSYP